ncbi:hypothetical protein [Sphingomonas hankookensis]|uniref:hypothetical protein n=1 Tax=Sphingomonas hankookensis TaxID=563996 RepID=UPI00234F95DB|nr:hypothetical protein [Sphingomonas hankookensis]WCP71576.1 hypothetical protein PPZ50_14625 [Sphingomonas hankookensis]
MVTINSESGTMTLLPAAPGKCQECASTHDADQPHNAQSLFYQVRFQMLHGRTPDWRDALSHCTEDVRKIWTDALAGHGIDVEAGQINQPMKGHRR